MPQRIPHQFFRRDVRSVAQDMLGAYLVVCARDGVARSVITEVEAYDGPHDKACHASRGRTQRTEVMFWRGGVLYVYLVYGMHDMLNVVAGEREYPAAVLVRSVSDVAGPGRLTKRFGITRASHGAPATRQAGVWFEYSGADVRSHEIEAGPRIGVAYAEEWADAPLRYIWRPER